MTSAPSRRRALIAGPGEIPTGDLPNTVELIVQSDDMEPSLIRGQPVMVDTWNPVPSPPGIFALWEHGELVYRRVMIIEGVRPAASSWKTHPDPDLAAKMEIASGVCGAALVWLGMDNKKYRPAERVVDVRDLRLYGRVIAAFRRL